MSFKAILDEVRQYYDGKLGAFGATPKGADWNSLESQELRFRQLLQVCDRSGTFSINDYGCGYGALVDYLSDQGYAFEYAGFDISENMITQARELHKGQECCDFFTEESQLTIADYTVASGIFNVSLETSDEEWRDYILTTLTKIAELSEQGFAFNALTRYSDQELMRRDLYYADPLFLFDHCKRIFSRFVSLLHDYPLYEFTILVRM
jgi:SAM-dependent methyltransferase